MNKYWKHFMTISKHKWIVMKLCFNCGIKWRGLMHDLSKYGPTEFWPSARYFQGTKSPIEAEKAKIGYSAAWQHHKGHNKHHWEYWTDFDDNGNVICCKIPMNYVCEMICDWVGAGIVYSKQKCNYNVPYKEPLEYYEAHKKGRYFHPSTQKLIEFYLELIARYGVNYFCENWYSAYNKEVSDYIKEDTQLNEDYKELSEE